MRDDLAAILGGRPVLRAAINTGNRALVQAEGETLRGVSPALARRLAARLGVMLEPVVYPGAGRVFGDAARDVWDVAFLAIDPVRALAVSFTRPYHTIEACYLVRAGSPLDRADTVDQDGIAIVAATGSAYDLHLTATLRHARLARYGTPPGSFAAFREGAGDVLAGVRASLERAFGDDPAYRLLPGLLTKVEQAMVLPGSANPLIGVLDAFVAEAIETGFVAGALADTAS